MLEASAIVRAEVLKVIDEAFEVRDVSGFSAQSELSIYTEVVSIQSAAWVAMC